jgi:hypothetical protein
MQVRTTAMEEGILDDVVRKLRGMTPKSRRKNRCWLKIRDLVMDTGNWKKAPGGKPDIRNLNGKPDHGFDAAY